jgi:hypothetical protein
MQVANILLPRAHLVPVGEDQLPHIELTREVARRFNRQFKEVFPEPKGLVVHAARVPGTDGRKMSKSYGNAVNLSDDPKTVYDKLVRMMTDPRRVRRTDPGDPKDCPAFRLHEIYCTEQEKAELTVGCRTASIGCVDCKKVMIRHVVAELEPIQERRRQLEASLGALRASHQAVKAELAGVQLELDDQARAMYMQGPPELVGLLEGADPLQIRSEPELRRAEVEAQAALVADVRRREAELAASLEQVGADLAAATVVHERDTADRRRMQVEADRLQATLKGIDRRLGGFLDAEEARAEAARRAGYAGYAARLGRAVSD